jgi:hypothetical protein
MDKRDGVYCLSDEIEATEAQRDDDGFGHWFRGDAQRACK